MTQKIDFAFSEDGDLILGPAKRDSDNEILYLHPDGTTGVIEQQGSVEIYDLSYARNRDCVRQIIFNRLKTDAPDWYHHPKMGASLSDLIGEPNRKETGDRGVEYIMDALTYNGFLERHQIDVRPVPINPDEIAFIITIALDDDEPYRLPLVFNLNHGIRGV